MNGDADVDEDVQAIDALLEAFVRAVESGDVARLGALFCEDATAYFSGSSDFVRGREALIGMWQRHLARWSDVTIRRYDTWVRIHGDVAWAHFLWDGEGADRGMRYRLSAERWTAVMLWEDGGWHLAQLHASMTYRDWESHRI